MIHICALQRPKHCRPLVDIVRWNGMFHIVAAKILPTAAWRKSIEPNVPNLIALLKDSDSSVRVSAAKALPILARHGVL
jgi:hypothetical protein